jgi:hypothetical protein
MSSALLVFPTHQRPEAGPASKGVPPAEVGPFFYLFAREDKPLATSERLQIINPAPKINSKSTEFR